MGTGHPPAYARDLALVHHERFGDVARAAARTLLAALRRRHPGGGTVVDLGCGSGILARALTDAGYEVLGLDLSEAMLDIAREEAPAATFVRGSFLDHPLPPCVAVAAVGEVFNYLVDGRAPDDRLGGLFHRIHAALHPGGLLLFDIAGPGRAGPEGARTSRLDHHQRTEGRDDLRDGRDWFLCARTEEDERHASLTREITLFLRTGTLYERRDEVHRLRLYPPDVVEDHLRRAGFTCRRLLSYGDLVLGPGWTGFLAERSASSGSPDLPGPAPEGTF